MDAYEVPEGAFINNKIRMFCKLVLGLGLSVGNH